MKNKGFTLAELLGVIALMAFLFIIVTPSIINSLRGSKDKVDTAMNKILYLAASQYISENSSSFPTGSKYCIKIKDLISDGKMASPVKNSSGKTIDNESVLVTLYSIGASDYDEMKNSECISDKSLPMIDFSSSNSGEITINYPEETTNFQYKTDDGTWQNASDDVRVSSISVNKISARAKYNNKYITADIDVP